MGGRRKAVVGKEVKRRRFLRVQKAEGQPQQVYSGEAEGTI